MIPLSKDFTKRRDNLFRSQELRAAGKKNKRGRWTRLPYVLPFDKKQFTAWLVDKFGGTGEGAIRCRYCPQPITVYTCQIDHGVPISRSGSPGLSNIDPTCPPCNAVKGKMTPEEFDFFLAKMQEMGDHFHNGIAVKDITHRLESYSGLKANANRARAQKQAAAAAPVAGSQDDDDF